MLFIVFFLCWRSRDEAEKNWSELLISVWEKVRVQVISETCSGELLQITVLGVWEIFILFQ